MENPSDPQALSAFWRQQVDLCHASGLSGAQFCKANDLLYHRFVYWRRKFEPDRHREAGSAGSGGFAAVRLQAQDHGGLSLLLPNGLVVRGICADNVVVVRQLLDQF